MGASQFGGVNRELTWRHLAGAALIPILLLLFFVLLTPVGIATRWVGDPLGLRFDRARRSYRRIRQR